MHIIHTFSTELCIQDIKTTKKKTRAKQKTNKRKPKTKHKKKKRNDNKGVIKLTTALPLSF